MHGDQFGEFVCGYWGLKVKEAKNRNICALQIKSLFMSFVLYAEAWVEC